MAGRAAAAATEVGARLDSLLDGAVRRHPDRTALLHGETTVRYAQLGAAAERLSVRIQEAAGDVDLRGARIAAIGGNVPMLVTALFAAWRLGAVAVPLSARLRETELGAMLADAEPVVVLSPRSHRTFSFADLLSRLVPTLPSVASVVLFDEDRTMSKELAAAARPEPAEPLGPDTAALLYTSGTTGRPKGALVTHARELAASAALADALGLGEDHVATFVIPIPHAFGLSCLLATIGAGGTALLVDAGFSPGPILAEIERRRADVLHGSPALFTSLLKARPQGVPGVRTGLVAGAASPPGLLVRLEATGTRILNCYGLTETGAVTCCRSEDPDELRHTTVGRPLSSFEVRVVPAERAESPAGELQIRGPHVTPGYYRRPEETDAAFVHGWFRTGDLARLENGYVSIAGREKELVHVAGFNVFPAEVEGVLAAHPDVVQAVVVGMPHETMGEALHAFVVAGPGVSPTTADLLQFARPRIAGYKLPYSISIVSELPLLATGKPDRLALRREVEAAARERTAAALGGGSRR